MSARTPLFHAERVGRRAWSMRQATTALMSTLRFNLCPQA